MCKDQLDIHLIVFTLCVRNVDIQNPLCAFQTFTVVSDEADITVK